MCHALWALFFQPPFSADKDVFPEDGRLSDEEPGRILSGSLSPQRQYVQLHLLKK